MKSPEIQNVLEAQVEQPKTPENVSSTQALKNLESSISTGELNFNQNNEKSIDKVKNYPGAEESDIENTQNINKEASLLLEEAKNKATLESSKLNGGKLEKNKARESADMLSQNISNLSEEEISGFIVEFNKNNNENLKSQELRLLKSENGKLLIINELGKLEQIEINKENTRDLLLEIKKKDEILRGESYNLRKEILKISEGDITTFEAYTYAAEIPEGGKLDSFLDDDKNWIPERLAIQKEIIESEYGKATELSKRLEDSDPTIYALRGNTAAGKTTSVRNNELFKKSLDQTGQPSGAINPDTYKTILKKNESKLNKETIGHQQAHEEGSMIARKISQKISESQSSMVIDKRMNKEKNIKELQKMALESNKLIKILDVDVPFETSLVRVLGRKIGGPDPTVPFGAVAEGFEGVRQNRLSLLRDVRGNPKIVDYVLYVADESGNSIKIAEKVNGEFTIIEGQRDNLKRILQEDPKSEVEKMSKTIIDETYIKSIIDKTPEGLRLKVQSSLEKYKGKSLKEALDLHALKLNED